MSTSRPFASVALIAAAFALVGAPGSAIAQAHAGWTYSTRMTTDSGGATKPSTSTITQYVTDTKLRFDISGASAGMPSGMPGTGGPMYVIINDADSTMTSVLPGMHTAIVMGTNFLSALGGFPMKTSVDTQPTFIDAGVGEALLGHPTHRYHSKATVSLALGDKCKLTQYVASDVWIAPDVDFLSVEQALMKRLGVFGSVMADALKTATIFTDMPRGTPLRMIAKTTTPDHPGLVVTTTVDVLTVAQGPLADSLFMVPESLHAMDMRGVMTPELLAGTKEQGAALIDKECADLKKH